MDHNEKKRLGASQGGALANFIMMMGLLVLFVVLVTRPLFYVVQSYCGGVFSNEEVQEICIAESRDLEEYHEANFGAQIKKKNK